MVNVGNVDIGNVKLIDHSDIAKEAMQEAMEAALETCGLKAEGYAKKLCPVDTGLLRNSITHAMSGESPAIENYNADEGEGKGSYSGITPKEIGGLAMYVGTNVEYAPYVHEGANGREPKRFIRDAVEGHADEWKGIIEKAKK